MDPIDCTVYLFFCFFLGVDFFKVLFFCVSSVFVFGFDILFCEELRVGLACEIS